MGENQEKGACGDVAITEAKAPPHATPNPRDGSCSQDSRQVVLCIRVKGEGEEGETLECLEVPERSDEQEFRRRFKVEGRDVRGDTLADLKKREETVLVRRGTSNAGKADARERVAYRAAGVPDNLAQLKVVEENKGHVDWESVYFCARRVR